MGRNGCRLLDDTLEIADFADQILNKTNFAWSVHVAGGNSYKCSIYQQSNASQMSITHIDQLKAALLGSKSNIYKQYTSMLCHNIFAVYMPCNDCSSIDHCPMAYT